MLSEAGIADAWVEEGTKARAGLAGFVLDEDVLVRVREVAEHGEDDLTGCGMEVVLWCKPDCHNGPLTVTDIVADPLVVIRLHKGMEVEVDDAQTLKVGRVAVRSFAILSGDGDHCLRKVLEVQESGARLQKKSPHGH